MLISSLIDFLYRPDPEQRPPPLPDSDVWSFESNFPRKQVAFRTFFPLILFFSLGALIDVKEAAVGSSQLLSWILPAWCNVLMILCIVRTCAVTSKQKKYPPPWKGGLLRQIIYASHITRPFESPSQDTLRFVLREMCENVWFPSFSSCTAQNDWEVLCVRWPWRSTAKHFIKYTETFSEMIKV